MTLTQAWTRMLTDRQLALLHRGQAFILLKLQMQSLRLESVHPVPRYGYGTIYGELCMLSQRRNACCTRPRAHVGPHVSRNFGASHDKILDIWD